MRRHSPRRPGSVTFLYRGGGAFDAIYLCSAHLLFSDEDLQSFDNIVFIVCCNTTYPRPIPDALCPLPVNVDPGSVHRTDIKWKISVSRHWDLLARMLQFDACVSSPKHLRSKTKHRRKFPLCSRVLQSVALNRSTRQVGVMEYDHEVHPLATCLQLIAPCPRLLVHSPQCS